MKSQPAQAVLDAHYLETRAKLLEVAAVLDRIDRAGASQASLSSDAVALSSDVDARRSQIDEAIQILLDDSPRRAELIQQLFSRQYDPQWRSNFGLPAEHVSPSDTRES